MNRYGIVLLAAGSSTRLGKPKQLLQFEGKSLVSRAAEAAVNSTADMVVVVVGGAAASVAPELANLPLRIAFNNQFENGMATSIRCGLAALDRERIDGAIFMVCVQPYLSATLLNELLNHGGRIADGIIASAYGDTVGTPVFFALKYFPDLLKLEDTEGAKKLLKKYSDKVVAISFPEGVTDIDTMRDYDQLLTREGKQKTSYTI